MPYGNDGLQFLPLVVSCPRHRQLGGRTAHESVRAAVPLSLHYYYCKLTQEP